MREPATGTATREADHLAAARREVDRALRRCLDAARGTPPVLRRAMAHSLFGGGKRLRPLLLLSAWEALRRPGRRGTDRRHVLAAAAAVEMIHTYSLIHDDLPAMDDDVLRRGRPTCHVVFGEAMAILAGDALQALAFETLAGVPVHGAALVRLLAAAAGPAGMVGGQVLDLQATAVPDVGPARIRRIHLGKTARLVAAPLVAGALLAGRGPATRERLERAGLDLGLAFQAVDDVLDATATTDRLGKTAGKDARDGKVTLVSAGGVAYAARRAERLGRRAERTLVELLPPGTATDRLLALTRRLWRRDH